MKAIDSLGTLAIALAMSALAAAGNGPGTAYCFGTACPCDNDDPGAGCVNSTGSGALMTATGSSSVLADDLTFTATSLPPTSVTLLVMGSQQVAIPFKDGMLCVGGQTERLWMHFNSGQAGTVSCGSVCGLFAAGGLTIAAGETWNFQMWFRDAPATMTPCGQKANLTNGYQMIFTP